MRDWTKKYIILVSRNKRMRTNGAGESERRGHSDLEAEDAERGSRRRRL